MPSLPAVIVLDVETNAQPASLTAIHPQTPFATASRA